ncbi:MAG: alkaline phosphatase [Methylacidiphilales bacterium]|nr:alkaline phosphatase [Candidatus Methylacidiphilales bacterium]
MNWRLRVLSLLILGVFAAFSVYYYRYYIAPKAQGIILFVVPGLSLYNLGLTEISDSTQPLNATLHSNGVAIVDNNTLQPYTADAVSIMSFVSTGEKGLPNQMGLDANGVPQDNLLYKAQRAGRTIGIVGTGSVTAPPLAAFYAHVTNANRTEELAKQVFDSTAINVILGGGGDAIASVKSDGGRDLLKEADLRGYKIVQNRADLEDVPAWRTRKLLGIFASQKLPYYDPLADESGQNPYPSLPDMTRRAIQCLEFNLNGYFLVVHQGLVADALRENNIPRVISEIRQLDLALKEARAYAGKKTLILLYCPYEVQGLPRGSGQILVTTESESGRRRASEPAEERHPLVFLGPFLPEFRSSLGFGWLSVYKQTGAVVEGFISPGDLSHFIEQQL